MTISKIAKRVVVGITAVLTLLCQSTALAHACGPGAATLASIEAHPPCHETTANDTQGPAHDAHPAPCLSQATSSSPALPDIPPLAGLPALVIYDAFLKFDESALLVSEPPPLRGEPPPLAILHCCLRN